MNKNQLRSLLLLSILYLQPVLAKEVKTLTMAYLELPPFSYINESGQADGILIKQAQKIVIAAGYQLKLTRLPIPRLKKSLAEGNVDFWMGIMHQSEWDSDVLFGEQAIESASLNIYTVNQEKISHWSALNYHKIIIIRGYNYGGIIDYIQDKKNGITAFEAKNHEFAFEMLVNHRADYLLAYNKPTELTLQHSDIEHLIASSLEKLPIIFIVSKKTPNAKTVLANLEKAITNN